MDKREASVIARGKFKQDGRCAAVQAETRPRLRATATRQQVKSFLESKGMFAVYCAAFKCWPYPSDATLRTSGKGEKMSSLILILVLSLSPMPLPRLLPEALVSLSAQNSVDPERPLGSVRGTVTSATGKRLAGATVRVEFRGSMWEVRTGGDGDYLISNLNPGNHQVKVTLAGYANIQKRVRVQPYRSSTLDFVLRVR